MKIASKLFKCLLFTVAFCASAWLFMPWRQVGAAVLTAAQGRLESRGMKLSFAGVDEVPGGFRVRGPGLSGFVRFSFQSLTLIPDLPSSLLALAPVCSVSFEEGEVFMGRSLPLGGGGAVITASSASVLLENLRTDGEFSINGFVAIDPAQMRIARADAAVRVPESFEGNMETLQAFLPLVREGDGRWFLRRDEGRPSQ